MFPWAQARGLCNAKVVCAIAVGLLLFQVTSTLTRHRALRITGALLDKVAENVGHGQAWINEQKSGLAKSTASNGSTASVPDRVELDAVPVPYPPALPFANSAPPSTMQALPQDKIVVIGKLDHEDTTWITKEAPDWLQAVHSLNNTNQALHTKTSKGHEASAYLTYILEHYDSLPSTIAFLHPHHRWSWHVDIGSGSNADILNRLNIDVVQRNGYVNLRCDWAPGCPHDVQPFRAPPDRPLGKEEWGPMVDAAMLEAWPVFFGASSLIPHELATPCCAQFAVSRAQVR